MKKLILLFIFSISASISFSQVKSGENATDKKAENKYANSKFGYNTIDSQNHTFGYEISADGNKIISQPNIPGLPGNDGFRTKNDAQKVARLAITKIQKGDFPPTISYEELKKLNVVK